MMDSDDDYSPMSESEEESEPEGPEEEPEPGPGHYPMPPPRRPEAAVVHNASSESGRSTASLASRRGGVRKKRRSRGDDEPDTDYKAYKLLLQKERLNFANLGCDTLAVYNDETFLWSIDDGALDHLCARQAGVLGDFYGEQNQGVKRLVDKCKRYDAKPSEWQLGFDAKLELGELPLHDCIYNFLTRTRKAYSSDKMCTVKMSMTLEEAEMPCSEEDRAEVRRILRQMFPEDALYAIALSRLALAMFHHRNLHREVLVFYGDGANGKTVLIKLLRMIFGDLVVTLSMNNLKETPDSAGDKPMAWPRMLQGARLAIFDEMNGNVDGPLLKRLRGDDVFEYRVQHSPKIQTQQITATIALFGNDPPQCPKADRALSDSLIALHMPSKGVLGAPDPDPKKLQFQIDPNILNKFHGVGMQVAMVQELSDHLRAYIARGRKHPDAESEYNFTGYMLNLESKTVEDIIWSIVTTEGARPEDSIKNSELYDAARSNGYNQSKTKFTRDTKMILRNNANNVAYVTHAKQFVYKNLKWLDRQMQTERNDPFEQQF